MFSAITCTRTTVCEYGRYPGRNARHVLFRHVAATSPVESRKSAADIPCNCDFLADFDVAGRNEAEVVVGRTSDDDLELSIGRAAAPDVSHGCAFVPRVDAYGELRMEENKRFRVSKS
jgi:hypothetical protein